MMANPPPWTNEEMNHHNAYSRNLTTPSESSLMMRHNPGIAMEWKPEEDKVLLDRLASVCLPRSYPSGLSLALYVEVAACLENKCARDVAARWKWICLKKENAKRRKEDQNGLGRVARVDNKGIIDTVVASQQFEPSQNDIGDTNELLKQNMQWFDQISENFKPVTLMDNFELFNKIRKNINTVIANLKENMSETMKRMPILPEELNDELLFGMFSLSKSTMDM